MFKFSNVLCSQKLNSQAPDVPEFSHQRIFQLSRLSMNCYVKTVKKYSLYLKREDFMEILSVPQDHCQSQNYFTKIFSENYRFYGVYISLNSDFSLNRLSLNDTKTQYIYINSRQLS